MFAPVRKTLATGFANHATVVEGSGPDSLAASNPGRGDVVIVVSLMVHGPRMKREAVRQQCPSQRPVDDDASTCVEEQP